MLDFFKQSRPRGQCRISVSSDAVSVRFVSRSRKGTSSVVERALDALVIADPDALAAQIAAAIGEASEAGSGKALGRGHDQGRGRGHGQGQEQGRDQAREQGQANELAKRQAKVRGEDRKAAGARGAPIHVTLADDLVRYFIVTPPANVGRAQDLRAAASVRFQALYGSAAASWHIVADWQAAEPFLACAVSHHLVAALQMAATRVGGCLVSVTPGFVDAWNRSRKQLGAQVWVATLRHNALTVGLVGDSSKPRLASVRTLVLPDSAPSAAWLHDQITRIALLDNVAVPTALHIHGVPIEGWQAGRIAVHWHAPEHPSSSSKREDPAIATPLAWGGAAS